MRILIFFAMVLSAATASTAQICPASNESNSGKAPKAAIIRGRLRFHDDLRHWLGIELNRPLCGKTEIQIAFSKGDQWKRAKTLRGCTITATGKLYDSPTGYYSADLAIFDPIIKADSSCHPLPLEAGPRAHPSEIPHGPYQTSISIDYRGKGHVDVNVSQGEKKLIPWQDYVDYMLSGSAEVVWLYCAKDFRVTDITQVPENPDGITREKPSLIGVTVQGTTGVHVINFTCQESKATPRPTQPNSAH
ncbi:MAG TPA: hypothetical protein VGI16_09280 [Candidatus Acidoferrum sp.]|jgi:hypothetical protein